MSVGLIINGKSNRTASIADELIGVAGRFADVKTETLDGIHGLGETLDALNAKKVDTVIIAGGDGTMQATFTEAINNNRFEHVPNYVALPCGMTNVIAYDCGLRGNPVRSLEEFLKRRENGDVKTQRRSLLSVGAEGEPPVRGFFFGAAAFHSAVKYSRERVQAKGAKRSLALVASVTGYILKVARDPHDALDPANLDIIDGGEGAQIEGGYKERTLFLSTTLNRLGAGIFPFWGKGEGGMISTMIDFPARKLLWAAPFVLNSKSRPWFEETGYRSWRGDEMTVRFDGPYVFDGEEYSADKDRPLRLSSRHTINFLT